MKKIIRFVEEKKMKPLELDLSLKNKIADITLAD